MEEILSFLNANPVGTFATVMDGKPRTRPWGFGMQVDGKFYFTTANTKDVYKQLQANPNMEFNTMSKDMKWLRFSGEVVFTKDMEIKKMVFDHNPPLKQIYNAPDNPIFEVFYVEHGNASIHEFGGKPIVEVTF